MSPSSTRQSEGDAAAAWSNCELYRRGLELLNQGHYFDAHEILEEVWRAATGPERQFLQGLIQVAVALHHHSTGNVEGASSVIGRAARNLAPYSDIFGNIDLKALRAAVHHWQVALRQGRLPPVVKIVLARQA